MSGKHIGDIDAGHAENVDELPDASLDQVVGGTDPKSTVAATSKQSANQQKVGIASSKETGAPILPLP